MSSKSVADASVIRAWRKSTYSGGDGGDCIEVADHLPPAALLAWRKSSHSGGDNGSCVEVADGLTDVVPVRDSKNPHGPALVIPAGGWVGFVAAVKGGAFSE